MVKQIPPTKNSQRKSKIRIILERSDDSFSAYAKNIPGLYGQGNTVEEAKASVIKSINLFKKYNRTVQLPAGLRQNFKVEYQFDVSSFLNYYSSVFTRAALERLTGINQKQLQHYATGLKKPRANQVRKISDAINKLGQELLQVKF